MTSRKNKEQDVYVRERRPFPWIFQAKLFQVRYENQPYHWATEGDIAELILRRILRETQPGSGEYYRVPPEEYARQSTLVQQPIAHSPAMRQTRATPRTSYWGKLVIGFVVGAVILVLFGFGLNAGYTWYQMTFNIIGKYQNHGVLTDQFDGKVDGKLFHFTIENLGTYVDVVISDQKGGTIVHVDHILVYSGINVDKNTLVTGVLKDVNNDGFPDIVLQYHAIPSLSTKGDEYSVLVFDKQLGTFRLPKSTDHIDLNKIP